MHSFNFRRKCTRLLNTSNPLEHSVRHSHPIRSLLKYKIELFLYHDSPQEEFARHVEDFVGIGFSFRGKSPAALPRPLAETPSRPPSLVQGTPETRPASSVRGKDAILRQSQFHVRFFDLNFCVSSTRSRYTFIIRARLFTFPNSGLGRLDAHRRDCVGCSVPVRTRRQRTRWPLVRIAERACTTPRGGFLRMQPTWQRR